MAVSGAQKTRIGIGPAVGIAVTILAKGSNAATDILTSAVYLTGISRAPVTVQGISKKSVTITGPAS